MYVCMSVCGTIASTIFTWLSSNLAWRCILVVIRCVLQMGPIHNVVSALGLKNQQFLGKICINKERIERICHFLLHVWVDLTETHFQFKFQIDRACGFGDRSQSRCHTKIFWNSERILSDSNQTSYISFFHGKKCLAKIWNRYDDWFRSYIGWTWVLIICGPMPSIWTMININLT